jgi:hypothetical protein
MPIARIEMPDGSIARIEVEEGTTPEQAEAYALEQQQRADAFLAQAEQQLSQPQPEAPGFGEQLSRQLGLTARHGIEGLGEAAGIFTNPLTYGMERAAGKDYPTSAEMASGLADKLGLPVPETTGERVVGAAAKTILPVGGMASTASRASQFAPEVVQGVSRTLATAPVAQMSGAAAGGGASQYAAETGAGPYGQFAAGLAGGFGGAAVPAAAVTLGRSLSNAANTVVNTLRGTRSSVDDINAALNEVLGVNGMSIDDIVGPARLELINDMRRAMDTGSEVNPIILQRIADYHAVGATPTRAGVTLDPVHITQERNLQKIGASSQDPNLQQLARHQRDTDLRLMGELDEMGAAAAVEPPVAGAGLQGVLRDQDVPRRRALDNAYQAVRDSEGRAAQLDRPRPAATRIFSAGRGKEHAERYSARRECAGQ